MLIESAAFSGRKTAGLCRGIRCQSFPGGQQLADRTVVVSECRFLHRTWLFVWLSMMECKSSECR